MKKQMIMRIIENPYDEDREAFINTCRQNIHFMQDIQKNLIRQLFYSCKHYFYNFDSVLFEYNTPCDGIYLILNGTAEI
jgi:hypothetical protein